MDQLIDDAGFVDVFRSLYPDKAAYTWWSNRGRAREKDVGWRIDYHIATSSIAKLAITASVHSRHDRFSDHAPLTIDYRYDF
jgi:exodeoxyribonuclease-3